MAEGVQPPGGGSPAGSGGPDARRHGRRGRGRRGRGLDRAGGLSGAERLTVPRPPADPRGEAARVDRPAAPPPASLQARRPDAPVPRVASPADTGGAPAPIPPALSQPLLDPESILDDVETGGWDESRVPVDVVDVELSPLGPVAPFDAQGIALVPGDRVVVATARGIELGRVVRGARVEMRRVWEMPKVIRRAGAGDHRQARRNVERAAEARELVKRRIADMGLQMKLLDIEILHGGARAVVHFEAEDRVDYRPLLHELADKLRVRVDMRQAGARDSTRTVGAIGRCGQEVCCARFLRDFTQVGIRMAKDQNLPLTPEKVSGVCGRLLCCLAYEHDGYRALRERLPKIGRRIATPDGEAVVRDVDILRRRVGVEMMSDGKRRTFGAAELGLDAPDARPCGSPEPCGDGERPSCMAPAPDPRSPAPDGRHRRRRRRHGRGGPIGGAPQGGGGPPAQPGGAGG